MSNIIFDYPELLENDEELVPLTRACKELFRPPISKPSIDRFAYVGVRDEFLRTVKIGGIRCTTKSEVKRFSLAQLQNPAPTDTVDDESVIKVPKRSTKKTGGGMTQEQIATGLARHGLK